MKYIVKHLGFSRRERRHDASAQLYIKEGKRTGNPVPLNKPYVKK